MPQGSGNWMTYATRLASHHAHPSRTVQMHGNVYFRAHSRHRKTETSTSQTFQRFMDTIFRDLPHVFVYIDDILVSSVDHTEHEAHLREVIRRLAEQGLSLNLQKCLYGVNEVDFLGYRISSSGISPRPTKVEEITSYPRPETVNGLRKFHGMVNFYRRSLPHAAGHT
ncbi:hypothetical protein AAG570_014138 [Ranatra chinensis]|uniref:Reverse transcriptase domain-containing protein n=1 Tax=Ranatra chinensis TaxID=642074 RepID=A0ABD0YDL6_9HEMI